MNFQILFCIFLWKHKSKLLNNKIFYHHLNTTTFMCHHYEKEKGLAIKPIFLWHAILNAFVFHFFLPKLLSILKYQKFIFKPISTRLYAILSKNWVYSLTLSKWVNFDISCHVNLCVALAPAPSHEWHPTRNQFDDFYAFKSSRFSQSQRQRQPPGLAYIF